MKAEYFYNEVMSGNHENEGYDGWYCGGTINIHKIGSSDKDIYYALHSNGYIIDSNGKRDYSIYDLVGEYEPYNTVQIFKCGYLVFNTSTFDEIKQIINNLHNKMQAEEHDFAVSEKVKRFLCGGSCWDKGLTEGFSYYASNGIQLNIYSIPEICRKNVRRSKFGKKCLPFAKEFKKENSIYVSFERNIKDPKGNFDKRCDEALKELKDLIGSISDCKWFNMKMSRYIYS